MRLLIALLFISCSLLAQTPGNSSGTSSGTPTPKFILGKVLDQETGAPVDNGSVINKRSQAVGRTNQTGAFYLQVKPGDSVIVTSPSHGRAGIKWDGVTPSPVIKMQRQYSGITLAEVTVTAKREAEIRRELEVLLREPEARRNLSAEEIVGLAQSPVTLLYELFSRQAKANRKAAVIAQEHRRHMLAGYRMGLIAGRATDLKGDDLERFIDYTNFSDEFILFSSEYDLTFAVLQRYKQYQSRR
ncbi:hypothetical protein GCM10023189_48030 [Nibrella saemangeumensis]|uniref:CarboxypepD_reg-like domain-containing protein n=1 Tax=Nibrella saemangeumensis TaxID=1084526 RepID=A0ABP8NF92_9BACT